tara:strand:- start:562 stop:810 length:249 start_codon:yes stop_codon:yes gene_type:complete
MAKVSKEHKLKVIESQKNRRIKKARKTREQNIKNIPKKVSGLTERYLKKQIQNVFEADSTAAVNRANKQKRKYFNNTYEEGK